VMTDMEPGVGGSESMRSVTAGDRFILVSGFGVYDVSHCEDIVKKGEIKWPSENAMSGRGPRLGVRDEQAVQFPDRCSQFL
jgi:hypothetical protein